MGLPRLVQDNASRSRRDVLRGLHYQMEPAAMGKLVRCARGKIFDVCVDIRRGSPHYGRWVGRELSEDDPAMIYVPPGFAHGFLALSDWADVVYKTSAYYSPEHERATLWSDPDVGIRWPRARPRLSAKDAAAPLLKDAQNNFVYGPSSKSVTS